MDILFVCTGNTCRSPMAEYFARQYIENNNLKDFNVASAGINAATGQSASQEAIKVMKEKGIDISDHKSKSLMEEDLQENDKVLTMTNSHKEVIQDMYDYENVYTLKHFVKRCEDRDILDPYGFEVDKYRETRDEIEDAVKKLLAKMSKE
ncbi:MAG: low molecular weight protein arginine phosphatase [Halanaerobiales bacterium]